MPCPFLSMLLSLPPMNSNGENGFPPTPGLCPDDLLQPPPGREKRQQFIGAQCPLRPVGHINHYLKQALFNKGKIIIIPKGSQINPFFTAFFSAFLFPYHRQFFLLPQSREKSGGLLLVPCGGVLRRNNEEKNIGKTVNQTH